MIIAALLLMQAATDAAETPCTTVLRGGIVDGMCIGDVEPDKSNVLVILRPAPKPGPPLPKDIAKTLDRLLKAQAKDRLKLPSRSLAEDATSRFCSDWTERCMETEPLTALPLGAYFTPNTPYQLPDGRVRVEWMLGVTLDYMSLIAFEGEKIKSIDTTPATIPMAKDPRIR